MAQQMHPFSESKKGDLRTIVYEHEVKQVDYVGQPIPYHEFFTRYLLPNKICHLGPWVTAGWTSRNKWVTCDGKPNISYLKETFGAAVKCPVANCNQQEYDAHCKTENSFDDYMKYFDDYSKQGHPKDQPCLYLKDWHFTKVFPDYGAYDLPVFFQSDWLNEFLDEKGWEENKECDDYRFVYIGPKGSWTPFHSDVLRSHSWSANICGTKLWIFFPPGEEKKLCDKYGHLPFDLRADELNNETKYPNGVKEARRLEVIQKQGEVIFVPSGWHHQVINLEDTISINHNWINGTNIDLTWQFLCDSLCEVQKEISDCRDMEGWHQQCQLILKASCGVDYLGFYNFLSFIANKRLSELRKGDTADLTNMYSTVDNTKDNDPSQLGSLQINWETKVQTAEFSPSQNKLKVDSLMHPSSYSHILFDLGQARYVLKDMLDNEEFVTLVKENTVMHSITEPSALLNKIETAIRTCGQ